MIQIPSEEGVEADITSNPNMLICKRCKEIKLAPFFPMKNRNICKECHAKSQKAQKLRTQPRNVYPLAQAFNAYQRDLNKPKF